MPEQREPIDWQDFEQTFSGIASAMGYDLYGLTSPQLEEDLHGDYQSWHEARTAEAETADFKPDEMDWLSEHLECRLNAARLGLEGGQINAAGVLAQVYKPGRQPRSGIWKRVAAYARGRDYHNVLRKKGRKFIRQLQQTYPSIKARTVVDSAPAAEKALALQAGLGWQGKNTLVIHPRLGSEFFISVILMDIPLGKPVPIQERMTDHCGSCTACLDACPTNALTSSKPRQLLASECISYWTIEQKSQPSPSQLDQNRDWIFGCDICQDVCPFNRKRSNVNSLLFSGRPAAMQQAAAHSWQEEAFLQLDPRQRELLYGSPLSRAGVERLQLWLKNCLSSR
jgi:epoxyqueuosine reductase